MEKKKVMVAVDESEFSHYALEWALDHLKDTLVNSDLVIFTVVPNTNFGYVYASSFGSARQYFLSLYFKISVSTWVFILIDSSLLLNILVFAGICSSGIDCIYAR